MLGNPTGGQVVAGSATIGSAGKTLTINQSSNNAIINWQQFSINSGELTKFLVPSSSSATLNLVLGGNPSAIYGTLQSNGQLFLINPSGIVVGAGGRIDTAGFLGSTLNVSNDEFLKGGDLNFVGTSDATIENAGVIHASSGDVYLIANQVANSGTLSAPQGNVGVAAGLDVLFQQVGDQHLFVQATPAGTTRAVGVTNSGTVQAASVELKAAGGNAYALAINNTGTIAATGFKKVKGQVYLTSDGGTITNSGHISAKNANGNGGTIVVNGSGTSSSGTVINSGTLDVSATAAGGQGGSVMLKNNGGTTIHSGTILAKGGQGGIGGNAEISGATVQFTGTVDLTAPNGGTGDLLLDPAMLEVITGGSGTVVGGENDSTSTEIDPATVEAALATANLTLNADTNITVTDGITWTSTNTLTLSTNTAGSTINLNAPISGVNGGLTIDTAAATDVISPTSSVNVASFILQSGSWQQSGGATLPAFTASYDFEVNGSSLFIRSVGSGTGIPSAPYQITDIYGLQGMDANNELPGVNAILINNIDASGTATWNGGAGFVPIGNSTTNYTGTFNGQGFTINGLAIHTPGGVSTGLFGYTGSTALVENVGVTNVQISGGNNVGALLGYNNGGTITDSFSTGAVSGSVGDVSVGGLVGFSSSGTISDSYSSAAVSGDTYVGGLVGQNYDVISNSYSTGAVSGNSYLGGLTAYNAGTITNVYSSGAVNGGGVVGGLVAYNADTINNSFWDTTTSGITSPTGGVGSGTNAGVTGDSTATLLMASTYSGAGWSIGTDLANDTWVIFDGQTRPMLAMEYNTTISNDHQLQLIGLNSTTMAATYTLANDIDLTGITNPSEVWGTSTTNGGAGFVPIGRYDGSDSSDANTFHGTLNGQGYAINGLYINAPGATSVGLFGDTADDSILEDVNLTNVNVTGDTYVGGLAGVNNATVSNVSSTGTVIGTTYVGGLLGINAGLISASYSTASVIGNGGGFDIGGLVGFNQFNTLSNVYSTGAVSGSVNVGGLVGENGAAISNAYSTGAVSGTGDVGGLVGNNGGTINNSFWDTETAGSGVVSGVGSDATPNTTAGVTEATTSQLEMQSYILANAPTSPTWDFTRVWTTNGDTTTPQLTGLSSGPGTTDTLSGTDFSDGGVTFSTGTTIDLIFDGSLLGTDITNGSGGFSFSISSTDLTGGILLTDATHNGNTFYQANSPLSSISNIDIWGGTLRVVADAAGNAALGRVASSLTGSGINYTVSGANLSTTSGVNMDILSNYALDGNITASGTLSTGADAAITSSTSVTLTASSAALSGTFNLGGALTVDAPGAITLTGATVTTTGTNLVFNSSLTGAGFVDLQDSTLSLNGGNFTANGNGYTSAVDDNGEANGVNLFNSTINAGGGSIALTGNAGYGNPGSGISAGQGVGIFTDNTPLVTLSTTGGGNITITGTFNQNITSQSEISAVLILADVSGSTNTLSVANGTLSITGTVSQGMAAGTGNNGASIGGVTIQTGSVLQATGAGSISLTGNTSGATSLISSGNFSGILGVEVAGNLSVAGGGIGIHGTSGTIDTSNSTITGNNLPVTIGVNIDNGAQITTGTNATMTVAGTGGAVTTTGAFTGESEGVVFNNGTMVSMNSGGTLTITGNGGAVNAGNGANAGDAGTGGVDIGSNLAMATGGSISITGTGGSLDISNAAEVTDNNIPISSGVSVHGGADVAASGSATVTLMGTGGNVNAGSSLVGGSIGVDIGDDKPSSTVLSSASGKIQVTGISESAPSLGIGVVVHGFDGGSALVESTTGNIVFTGTGGSGYTGTGTPEGDYIPDNGITIADDVTLMTGGSGSISLTGTGGSNSHGLSIRELTGDTVLDTDPVLPVITAGGAFAATALSGTDIYLNATVTAASATLGSGTAGNFASITSGSLDIESSTITLTGGNLTAFGAGQALDLNGIDIESSIINAQGGSISLTGQAGYDASGSTAGLGVLLGGSTLETVGTGMITVAGAGSIGSSNTAIGGDLQGVAMEGGSLSTVNGAIAITGTVSSGSASTEAGIAITGGSQIDASGPVNGNITLNGSAAGSVGSVTVGVFLSDPGTSLTAAGTSGISITGTGGTDTGDASVTISGVGFNPTTAGVFLQNGAQISATGAGRVDLTGTGGADQSTSPSSSFGGSGGVWFNAGSTSLVHVTSAAGGISITGTAGSGAGTFFNDGIQLQEAVVQDTGNGAVTLMGTSGLGQDDNTGVQIDGATTIVQAGSGSSSGLLTITGLASVSGVTGQSNEGVSIFNAAQIISGSGGITITGTAPTGGTDYNDGLEVAGGSISTADEGAITLKGTAAGIGSDNQGFSAFNASSITSGGGNISITGISTAGGDSFDTGVTIDGSSVTTTGTGMLTLNGTSAGGSDYLDEGVLISFGASLSTGSGLISITGKVTGSAPNGGIGVDVSPFASSGEAIAISSSSGSITINGTGGAGNTGSSLDANPYAANAGIRINDASTLTAVNLTLTGSGTGVNATGVDISSNLGSTQPDLVISGALSVTSNAGLINDDAGGGGGISNFFSAPAGTSSILTGVVGPLSLSGGGFTVTPVAGITFDTVSVTGLTVIASGDISLGTTTATSGLTLTGGNISQAGALTTALLIIPSGNNITLANTGNNISALGTINDTASLSIFTDPGLTIGGIISGDNPVLIREMGNNLTIGPGGQVNGSTVNLVTNHYLINDSEFGASAVQATDNYYIYSSDPTYTQLGGITPDFTQFSTTYPAGSFPSGNGVFYQVASANQVGNFGPSSPTTSPATSGDGSNTTPPAVTPQQTQINPQQPPPDSGAISENGSNPPPFDFLGDGIASQTGLQTGGLADSSGNSGTVGSGDAAQLDNGNLNNVANPAAAGALNQALSGPVRNSLADALQSLGEWTAAADVSPTVNNPDGGQVTTMGAGDVVEIGDTGVKTIPLSQAPPQLRNALGNGVFNGLQSGSGARH